MKRVLQSTLMPFMNGQVSTHGPPPAPVLVVELVLCDPLEGAPPSPAPPVPPPPSPPEPSVLDVPLLFAEQAASAIAAAARRSARPRMRALFIDGLPSKRHRRPPEAPRRSLAGCCSSRAPCRRGRGARARGISHRPCSRPDRRR